MRRAAQKTPATTITGAAAAASPTKLMMHLPLEHVNAILSVDGEDPPPPRSLAHLSSPEERRERFEEHQAFQDEVRREFAEKGFYEVEARYFTELADFQAKMQEKMAKIGCRGVNVNIFGGFM
uniref:Uncharacterized protein n=1 Tax=Oryza punctata TaxID=4537 RepID=A0A0E0MH13_ORYPU